MVRSRSLFSVFMTAGLLVTAAGCNRAPAVGTQEPSHAAVAAPKPQPTADRVMERSRQRWKFVCNGDWVETYDFLTPEQKRVLKLQQFLQGKDSHVYENARPVEVLKIDGEQAFVRANAIWTPQHPMLAKVKLEPGQSLTQELEMMETWRWVGNDWFYVQAERPNEFFEEHPDFLKKAEPTVPAATEEPTAKK